MITYLSNQTDRNNPMLTVIKSIVLLFLFFCGMNFVRADEKTTGVINNLSAPYRHLTDIVPKSLPTYSGTCDNIKPAHNIHELLFQVYTHLDDRCLYFMPTEELSKKLGVKIFSSKDEKLEYIYDSFEEKEKVLAKLENMSMDCGNFSCYVYLIKSASINSGKSNKPEDLRAHISFTIFPTKAYIKKYDGLFPEHKLPRLIPPAKVEMIGAIDRFFTRGNDCAWDIRQCHNKPDTTWGEFFYATAYDWFGKKGVLYFLTVNTHAIPMIEFRNYQLNNKGKPNVIK